MTNSLFIIACIASLFQVCFLPGWIITHFVKVGNFLLKRLVVGFGLGLMFNYLAVFALTSLHLYTQASMWILFAVELVVLYFISGITKKNIGEAGNTLTERLFEIRKNATTWFHEELGDARTNYFKIAILILILATFGYIAFLFIENIGTIFKFSDSVTSWNRWAVEWGTNSLPQHTWEYPQLIPANWSIFYVFLGVPLEYLAKLIMPLFPFGIILLMFLFGIKRNAEGKAQWGYLVAIPAAILLMRLMVGSELMATEGYVDTAVAFFAFASVIAILESRLLVGALLVAGALMTKQAGFYIAVIYPFLAWILVIRHNMELRMKWWKLLLIYIAILVVLAGPFYIYKQVAINAAQDVTVTSAINDLIYGGGKSAVAVASYALCFLIPKTHGLIALYFILLLLALRDKRYRAIALLVAIPYTIVWSVANSYDTRNLTLALPFWALGAGIGLQYLFLENKAFNNFISKVKFIYIIALLILAALLAGPWVKGKVGEMFAKDQKYTGDIELSVLLNNYFENIPASEKVLTNYSSLYFFPGFKDRIYSIHGGYSNAKNDFDNFAVDSLDPKVSYVLAAFYTEPGIAENIEQKIKDGRFTLVFRTNRNVLVKTNNK